MTEARNDYGVPVVSKDVPLTMLEATAARTAFIKVLLQTPPSRFWDDLHRAYASVCITWGLPMRLK